MARLLVLFAHPALEKSRVQQELVARCPRDIVTFHDLYEAYPDFDVDVRREQELLAAHDTIVFQHPLYWYSTPALVKQWEDLVLEHGWAYGAHGTALRGKRWLHVITAGGRGTAYGTGGHNRFTIRQLLAPLDQTARLCGMRFLAPYVVFGTHRLHGAEIAREGERYEAMLRALADDRVDLDHAERASTLNDVLFPTPDGET